MQFHSGIFTNVSGVTHESTEAVLERRVVCISSGGMQGRWMGIEVLFMQSAIAKAQIITFTRVLYPNKLKVT